MPETIEETFSDSSVKEDIARRLIYWRTQAKISRAELARRTNRNRGEITKWEAGLVTPGIVNVMRIATVCGVSLAMFLTAELPGDQACQE